MGTGLSAMLTELAMRREEGRLFALDISYVNLKAVRGKLRYLGVRGTVHLVVGDALRMPFRSEAFDLVESWFGLGSIVGFRRVVGEVCRVLRRGGAPGGLRVPGGGAL